MAVVPDRSSGSHELELIYTCNPSRWSIVVSGEIGLRNSRDSVDVYKAQRIPGGEA